MPTLRDVALDDKYTLEQGRVLLSGVQALVRLPLLQRQRDRAAGLNTAGFISGYRGSPLGGYDSALLRAQRHLQAHDIHFQPGLNEDLAATAVWGTQQLDADPNRTVDGVCALWYGKGPGVDRSGDPFRHGHVSGSARHGGVLLVCGDDHAGKSSTVTQHSEPVLMAAQIPVLYPASIQEILDFGLYGWALSRYAGVWVGLKCVNETAEATATVDIDPQRVTVLCPDRPLPPEGIHYQPAFGPLNEERHLLHVRLPRVQAFARANTIDRVVFPPGVLGIITAGKAYGDVRHALQRLGIDAERAQQLGIGVYKPGLVWPLEPQRLREFAAGCQEVLVVEEKTPIIEQQAAHILYACQPRPRLLGRHDTEGQPLLPGDVPLDPVPLALVIGQRLRVLGRTDAALEVHLADLSARWARPLQPASRVVQRQAYFCSGCPHNRSTTVPEGSQALSGIGCHTMALWMNRHTAKPTQMGGEGMNWTGMAPFTRTPHIFQNMGDGTYAHSGLLAIRAARLSGANITFKILFNDAVAMTGGQAVEGPLTVPMVAEQLRAEGIERIEILSEQPRHYRRQRLPSGIRVQDRGQLDAVQRELRQVPGVSVLIYDQTCAAEKRRRRKRGQYPDPAQRVFIHPEVCEGCGDCAVQSNCVSIQPLETPLGRKRRIDQASCNKDFTCLQGFCPALVTVEGGSLRRPDAAAWSEAEYAALPEPSLGDLAVAPCNILITGIGGTGVVTVGAVLAMAAHLDGAAAQVYDMTGLAQKNGAVLSHLRLAAHPEQLHAAAIGVAEADVVLGGDLIVTGSLDALRTLAAGRSQVVVNSSVVPTAQFLQQPDLDFAAERFLQSLAEQVGEAGLHPVAATELAQYRLGDSIGANFLLVGYAWQLGYLPLSAAAIQRAMELNGVAVAFNQQAFALGRLLAHNPARVVMPAAESTAGFGDIDELIAQRAEHLLHYQDQAYAMRFRTLVNKVRRVEAERLGGRTELTAAVAQSLWRVMAYKDEYEVARLYTEAAFRQRLDQQFSGAYRLRFHFSPPLSPVDSATGRPRKWAVGSWVLPLLRGLARLKGLRGTVFDPFGYTTERRLERQLLHDYQQQIEDILDALNRDNYAFAVELAGLAGQIRGFGVVKQARIDRIQARQTELMAAYRASDPDIQAV